MSEDGPSPGGEETHPVRVRPPQCGVCADGIELDEALYCAECASPHHPECWQFNEGCSIFGCGGRVPTSRAALLGSLASRELVIDEGTRPPFRLGPVFQGIVRRFQVRRRFLPATLTAGVVGSLLAVGVCTAFGVFDYVRDLVFWGMLGTGVLYGALAPFLAPLQYRAPRRMAAVSLLGFTGLFYGLTLLRPEGVFAAAGIAGVLFLVVLFGTSMGEWLAGVRSGLARRLGRLSVPVRLTISWLGFVVGMYVVAWLDAGQPRSLLRDVSLMGLLTLTAVAPAMEQGKRSFLEAIEPGREALPAAADPDHDPAPGAEPGVTPEDPAVSG